MPALTIPLFGQIFSRSGRPVGFEPTRGTGVSDHLPVVGRIGIAG
jgi:hypothetical protein